jgi:endoglucanase
MKWTTPLRIGAISVVLVFLASGKTFSSSGDSWPLWEHYKTHFLTNDGRIVDWDAAERTTSEGQSYALFFSLIADDRATFDRILSWTDMHLAKNNLGGILPAWLWGRNANGQWCVTDANSASDSDLWIAYTLIQAGRVWGDPSYTARGRALASRIAAEEVFSPPGAGNLLAAGRSGFHPEPEVVITNPSYLPPQILAELQTESPEGPWREIANNLPELLSASIGHGYAMDWVEFRTGTGFTAAPGPTKSTTGSYDAIRVYLWAGMMNPQTPGRDQLLQSLSGMRLYLRNHAVPPERVAPDGSVLSERSPVAFSAAVVPFLSSVGEQSALNTQSSRMKSEFLSSTGLYGKDQRYYDQNLALFAEGWTEGRFQFSPQGQLQLRWKKQ